MEHAFGWLPHESTDWRQHAEHRQVHLMAVLAKAHKDDEAREIERMLADVDAAIRAGDAVASESGGQPGASPKIPMLTERQQQALAHPCRCPECRRSCAA